MGMAVGASATRCAIASISPCRSDIDGLLGQLAEVRQRGGEYRYVFDFGYHTDDVPSRPDLIATQIAECDGVLGPRDGSARRPPPARAAFQSSHDGSLAWGFGFSSDTGRNFTASIRKDGTMERVIDVTVPAEAE